jgi:predicted DNA-binding transcriptional regulator AlpA
MPGPDNDNRTILAVLGPTDAGGAAELVDEASLAARLGVSRSTLQSWRYGGRGPRFIKLGRMVRYRPADIEAYLAANTHGEVA